jgi:hypothetical protein
MLEVRLKNLYENTKEIYPPIKVTNVYWQAQETQTTVHYSLLLSSVSHRLSQTSFFGFWISVAVFRTEDKLTMTSNCTP